MSDFPVRRFDPPRTSLTTTGGASPIGLNDGGFRADISGNSAVFPATGRIIYCPVMCEMSATIYQLGWGNGATVAGNVEVGVYDERGTRLVTTTAVAMSGASSPQFVDITDLPIIPGVYYLAMVVTSATATFARSSMNAAILRASGVTQQANATLPTSATFAAAASSYVPYVTATLTATV